MRLRHPEPSSISPRGGRKRAESVGPGGQSEARVLGRLSTSPPVSVAATRRVGFRLPGRVLVRMPGDPVRGGQAHGPVGTRCCDVITGNRSRKQTARSRSHQPGADWCGPPAVRGHRGGQSSEDARGSWPPTLGIQHVRAKLRCLSAGGAGSSHTHGPEAAECLGQRPLASFCFYTGRSDPPPCWRLWWGAMDKAF